MSYYYASDIIIKKKDASFDYRKLPEESTSMMKVMDLVTERFGPSS